MDRQEGYCWVKELGYSKHEIGYWNGTYWSLMEESEIYQNSDFEHINENRIKEPGELPEF